MNQKRPDIDKLECDALLMQKIGKHTKQEPADMLKLIDYVHTLEATECVDPKAKTLRLLQSEVGEWGQRNFGTIATWQPLMGAVEELGELAHAHLKCAQGIRGTAEQHAEAAQDALGDIIIYLADYARRSGFDLHDCVWQTWAQVSKRDWKKNPVDADKKAKE